MLYDNKGINPFKVPRLSCIRNDKPNGHHFVEGLLIQCKEALQLFSFLCGNTKRNLSGTTSLVSFGRCPDLFHLVLYQFTMPQVITQAIKDCIPVLIFRIGYTVLETCQILGIKKTTVYNTLGHYERYGTLTIWTPSPQTHHQ
jgi:hypothetical protein